MKGKVLRTIKLLSLVLALALSVGLLQEYVLCHADHNRQRVKGFFDEDKNSLDVVILGASEVYSDFAPGFAYEHSGITSYLYATQANTVLNYKAQLKNILSTQKPDLIVIELNGALYGDEELEEVTREANLRNYADNAPLDLTKLEWIKDNALGDWQEYLFPIMKYHGVWSDFPSNMLYQKTIIENHTRGHNYLKGILNETAVYKSVRSSMNPYLADSADGKQPLDGLSEERLRDLLQFCRDEKLGNVVFARFPHVVDGLTYNRFERSNMAGDIVREYGFDYLNFEVGFAQTGLDETTDFYNQDHLNVYGQKKFTAYLTDYLMKNYGVEAEELSGGKKDEWQKSADYYEAYYTYSDSLIKLGVRRELSEDSDLIDTLEKFLPENAA